MTTKTAKDRFFDWFCENFPAHIDDWQTRHMARSMTDADWQDVLTVICLCRDGYFRPC